MTPAAARTIKSPSIFERVLVAFVLFYGAVLFCLPVEVLEDVTYPWWATKINVGNIFLHELAFIFWMVLYGWRFVLRTLLNGGIPTHQAALWLIALALWCGVISLGAALPLQDLGRTFRLLLNAALLLAVMRWTWQMGNIPLGMLILGFFTGTIINLVVSFQNPFIVNQVMRLAGQNTPGVAMAMAIHLSAWLFYRTSSRALQTFSLIAAIVFAFGCGISYSRIGWFVGALGLVGWAYILIAARPQERVERWRLKETRRRWAPLLAIGLAVLLSSPLGQDNLQWVMTLVEQKFSADQGEQSDVVRSAYVLGVAEIVTKYPLGVGYSGFFDAMTATEVYRSGQAATEESYEANPHSAFLYYAAAGGIPGAVMIVAVFIMLLNSLRFGLASAFGRPGMILFLLAAPAFLVIGLAVPYLVNSIILIVPAAIAAGWGWTQREARAPAPLAAFHATNGQPVSARAD